MAESSTVSHLTSIEGKLALITGCSGGIGSATALALARRGCSIAVHYHSAKDKALQLVSKLQEFPAVKAAAFHADLGEYENVRKMYAEVVEKMGHPDILFNNVGIGGKTIGIKGDIQDLSVDEFERTWRVNTGSVYLLTQLCIPNMVQNKFGRVLFCSSVAAATGGVIGPHYASSKSALHGLLHWAAKRYATDGVTCNAVAPALIVETGLFPSPNPAILHNIPIGRFGYPDEIASIVEMLVTNAYMTNKIIVADGGWTGSAF